MVLYHFIQQIPLVVSRKKLNCETKGKIDFKKEEEKSGKKNASLYIRLLLQIQFDYCDGQTLCSSGQ